MRASKYHHFHNVLWYNVLWYLYHKNQTNEILTLMTLHNCHRWEVTGSVGSNVQNKYVQLNCPLVDRIRRVKRVSGNVKKDTVLNSKYCFAFFLDQCTIVIGVHPPPKNCSSLTNHLSAPNHRTDMKFCVYDPNTSKNNWEFFESFFIIKNWQKKYKNLVSVV